VLARGGCGRMRARLPEMDDRARARLVRGLDWIRAVKWETRVAPARGPLTLVLATATAVRNLPVMHPGGRTQAHPWRSPFAIQPAHPRTPCSESGWSKRNCFGSTAKQSIHESIETTGNKAV
jgi:hypothetical protein